MTNIVGPALSWRLVHDGASIVSISQSAGYTESVNPIFEADTEAACYAEAARLGIYAPVVPEMISMRQARLALLGAGLLANVDAAMAAMTGEAGEAARIEWGYSTTVERHQSLVLAMSAALGLTDAQVDALFVLAATL